MGREFRHPHLLEWVKENRGRILWALLTLARAWASVGRPAAKTQRIGGFETWCDVIGGILDYAGVPGFLGNLASLYDAADEDTADWEAFLSAIVDHFGSQHFTTAELMTAIEKDGLSLLLALPGDLTEAWSNSEPATFSKKLGVAFRSREGRPFGDEGYKIERGRKVSRALKWRVDSKRPPTVPGAG